MSAELFDTEHKVIDFHMRSGRVLRVTPNHPVLAADGSMKRADEFKVGDSLVELGGRLDPIVSLVANMHFGKVYNVFVKSSEPQRNVVVTNGYLNGTAFFQNEGASHLNKVLLRKKLLRGVF